MKPLISAIVSTYNARKFLPSRLENLLASSLSETLEIIVIDSGSEQNEAQIVAEFQKRFNSPSFEHVRYVRTEREGLYAAWNRAIRIARGKYLTSANTDDRICPRGFEQLVDALDSDDNYVLAYSDYFETTVEADILGSIPDFYSDFGESHSERMERIVADENDSPTSSGLNWRRIKLPAFSHRHLLLRCLCGAMPLWRKDIHDKVGYFDESFKVSGDWEFWLRMAEGHQFIHVPKPLGLVMKRDDSIVWSNIDKMLEENRRIRKTYYTFGSTTKASVPG